MTNPIPEFITTPMWNTWLDCKKFIPGVLLSGVYANKPGYHSEVERNLRFWPGNYSVLLDADLQGIKDKARAIDLTMSDAQMRHRTALLRNSALNPKDWRLYQLRSFIGTLDSKKVYCRIARDSRGLGEGRGEDDWSRDPSHFWHKHCSFFAKYVNNWSHFLPFISALKGQSFADWEEEAMATVEVNLSQRVDMYDEEGQKYWRAGETMRRKSASLSQIWQWAAESGWLLHDIVIPKIKNMENELTKARTDRELIMATLNALATAGTSVDTAVVLSALDATSASFSQEIRELREENDNLKARLSDAFGAG